MDGMFYLISFILNIVSTSVVALAAIAWFPIFICLAWMVPMTVHMGNIYWGKARNTMEFAVCTLLFVNVISGILLLVSSKD